MEERHDEHPEENLKQLLIINDQRNKEPSLREPVSEEQIWKSTNNNCLIIRTPELLRTYELFRKGDISSKQIVEAFTENSGLYNIEMLNIKSGGRTEEAKNEQRK